MNILSIFVFSVLFSLFLIGCVVEETKDVSFAKDSPVTENKKVTIVGSEQQKTVPVAAQQVVSSSSSSYPKTSQKQSIPQKQYEQSPIFTSLEGCEEKEKVVFTSLPLPYEAIRVVEPQGELTGYVSGHITPGDHVGFQYDAKGKAVDVYALADGYLVRIERNPGYFGIGVKNYHLYFEYSCSLFGSYVHVTQIAPELLNADTRFAELDGYAEEKVPQDKRYLYLRIPVKAGQVIGKAEKWGLLGMLTVDTSVTLQGFTTPALYSGEPWKTHAVPVFDYFSEELRKKIDVKNPRVSASRGGKIDFDVQGNLVGNWFVEGTDYAGAKEKGQYCGDYICPYWVGHVAFVDDFIDPSQIRVSLGYDAGLGDQGPYGVGKGGVDPRDVGVAKGIVKYELVKLKDVTTQKGFISQGKALITENTNEVLGTVLVEMVSDRKLKMEVFAGKKASEVSGFSGKEKVYMR